jgi:hypothetical protein
LFEGLPIQGSAAPWTVRNLLGESLASVVVVEKHPFVLPTYPPELPPEVSPPRARTHQTSHQPSSFTNMYGDSNLHSKTCPGLCPHIGKNGPKYVAGSRTEDGPYLYVHDPALPEVAQDEGEEEAYGSNEPDDRTALLVGLRHHGACEHSQDGPGGESLDNGDYIL